MSDKRLTIAIDGPAGAGKSTIARTVAKELGILYLDTGAMYRALALKAFELGIDPCDRKAVLPLLTDTDVTARSVDGVQHTYLDGRDVSDDIRTQIISKGASDISVHKEVRVKLAELQRRVGRENDVVMDGREIGSYVMPDAVIKFYVTADARVRAERRLLELRAKGQYMDKSIDDVTAEIVARDAVDSGREFAPLVRVPDAVFIDTTHMTAGEASRECLKYIVQKGALR